MNSKQRMFEALRGGRPDTVPVAPCYLHLYLERFMGRYYLEQYRRRIGKQTQMPIDHEEDTQFRANAIYQAWGIFEETFDWMPKLLNGSSYEWAENHYVERVGEDYCFVNRHNQRRLSFQDASQIVLSPRLGGGEGAPGLYQSIDENHDLWDLSANIDGVSDVDAAVPITSTQELSAQGVFELPHKIAQDYGSRFFLYVNADTPFSSAYDVVGFAGCMTMIYDRPELLHYIMERKLAQSYEVIKGFAKAGVHCVRLIETQASADLISPRHFNEFALPSMQRLVEKIKALDLIVMLYFCGDAVPRLEALRNLGLDAISLEEGKKTFKNDIKDIVERVGDVACVFGNIDAIGIMEQGTPAMIEAEVRRQLDAGKQARGFVASTGSPLPPTTNPRNVDTFVRAVRLYGQI